MPGLRAFVFIPLLINVVVLAAGMALLGWRWNTWMHYWLGLLPAWLHWLAALGWLLFAVAAVLIVFYFFALLANLIASPFNGFLAERVERWAGGTPEEDTVTLRAMLKDVRTEIRKQAFIFGRMLALAALTLVLIFIPGVHLLIPFLWFAFGAWTMALEYFDAPMSNHGYTLDAKRHWLRQNRALGLSFGALTTLATSVPGLNLLIMPAAIAGATVLWVRRENATLVVPEKVPRH